MLLKYLNKPSNELCFALKIIQRLAAFQPQCYRRKAPLYLYNQMCLAGFKYTKDGSVTCNLCKIDLEGWEEGDDPQKDHSKRSPDCPWLTVRLYLESEIERRKLQMLQQGKQAIQEFKEEAQRVRETL